MVFCRKLQKELPGLEVAPVVGSIGEVIVKNISAQAWADWLEYQIKIINEERLDLSEDLAQQKLYDSMISYLSIEDLIDLE